MTHPRRNGRNPNKPPERSRLAEDVTAFIRRFMVLSDTQALIVSLWIIHTHLIEHIEQTPYLSITSPDTECGEARHQGWRAVSHVDCAIATVVVREWARQQIGLGQAKLPAGWACDERSVCSNGPSSVTFTLVLP